MKMFLSNENATESHRKFFADTDIASQDRPGDLAGGSDSGGPDQMPSSASRSSGHHGYRPTNKQW
jgi:hypothetical protein